MKSLSRLARQKYIRSELASYAVANTIGFTTSLYLGYAAAGEGINAVATFFVKNTSFVGTKLLLHSKERKDLLSSNIIGTVIASFQLLSHFLALRTGFIPIEYAYILGYGIPGIVGSIIRYHMDHKKGLIFKD